MRDSKVAPFRLYDLRHTWATRAAESGIDLVTLAALLGHSKIQMVLRYAHPTQEHQARSVERMEQFVAARQIEALSQRQASSREDDSVRKDEESLRFPLQCPNSEAPSLGLSTIEIMEARVGIEPTHKGFADLSLTTWVPRHSVGYSFGKPC